MVPKPLHYPGRVTLAVAGRCIAAMSRGLPAGACWPSRGTWRTAVEDLVCFCSEKNSVLISLDGKRSSRWAAICQFSRWSHVAGACPKLGENTHQRLVPPPPHHHSWGKLTVFHCKVCPVETLRAALCLAADVTNEKKSEAFVLLV